MNNTTVTPQFQTPEIVAYRSNGRNYYMTFETPIGDKEVEVTESVYRRARIGLPVELPQVDAMINDLADFYSQSVTGIPMF